MKLTSNFPILIGILLLSNMLFSCATTESLNSNDKQASFLGMVYDTERNPVVDAKVSIIKDGKTIVENRSDIKGRFTIKSLPYDTYDIKIVSQGCEIRIDTIIFDKPTDVYYGKLQSFYSLFSQGLMLLHAGNMPDTIALVERLKAAQAPTDMISLLQAGYLINSGNSKAASTLLNSLLDGRPSDFELLLLIADLLERVHEKPGVIKVFLEKALKFRDDATVQKRLDEINLLLEKE